MNYNIFEPKRYIDWKIYNVTSMKKRYGFRMILYFEDGSNLTQQIGGFKTKKEAKEEREKVITELNTGKYIVNKSVSVSEFLDYWIANIVKKSFSHNTFVSYSNATYKHIIPEIGKLKLHTLNRGHLQKLYDKCTEFSVDIAEMVKTVMGTSLNYALSKKIIKTNPNKNIRLNKSDKIRHKKITLNMSQIQKLIEKSKETDIYLHVLFAVLMGLRRSEINGLKYSDIDFIRQKLIVERQLGIKPNTKKEDVEVDFYTKQEIELKSFSSNRELDIPDLVFEAIVEQKKIYEKNKKRRINDKTNPFMDKQYICCSSYGKPRSPNYVWRHFKNLLHDAELPDMRWHDLRTTYSTLLLKNNFNLKAVSKLLGHAKEDLTAEYYSNTKEIIVDCIKEIEPFLEKILPSEDNNLNKDFSEDKDIIFIIDIIVNRLT